MSEIINNKPGSSAAEQTIVEARGLNLYYGENHALKDINIEIPANRITALIGPSGCGKSTFLKTLNRMNDLIDSVRIDGEVIYNGENIYGKDVDVTRLRKQIGMVFQKANPFPMSIYDNIAYGPRTHGIRGKAKLDDIVERSLRDAAIWDEVKDRLNKSALGLSGGQQQRLSLALALVGRPELVFVDEPTAGMDPQARRTTWELLEELRADGVTVVLTTHHMDEAERLSDLVHVIDRGRVIASGTPAELTALGASATIRLVVSRPVTSDIVQALATDLGEGTTARALDATSVLVAGPADATTLSRVAAWCETHDVTPVSLALGQRTLEDVFLELTGREMSR